MPGDATPRLPATTSWPIHAAGLSLSAALPIFPGPSGLGLATLKGLPTCAGVGETRNPYTGIQSCPVSTGFLQFHHLPLINPAASVGASQIRHSPHIFVSPL